MRAQIQRPPEPLLFCLPGDRNFPAADIDRSAGDGATMPDLGSILVLHWFSPHEAASR